LLGWTALGQDNAAVLGGSNIDYERSTCELLWFQ
jgi:hypothetical protein